MTVYEPTPLDDALSLLEYEDTTWVIFKSRLFLSYECVWTWAHGLWNYVFDTCVFWVEHEGPTCLIVVDGDPASEADWSVYHSEEKLMSLFVKRFRDGKELCASMVRMDRG